MSKYLFYSIPTSSAYLLEVTGDSIGYEFALKSAVGLTLEPASSQMRSLCLRSLTSPNERAFVPLTSDPLSNKIKQMSSAEIFFMPHVA
ncbi:macrophage expressed protein [Plakobranchus ocellatus]|uniref:Macrophage expressed protein n=1 Tax=Plakobranchus ocellatus TaxID=259542 RepID=A0AAV4DLG2_9GAST|nr:macrophage expressed protein [Plakobranchus ocellatus]